MPEIRSTTPEAGIRLLTISNPPVRNAFSFEMYEKALSLVEALKFDKEARVVILTGEGQSFCSGHWVGQPGRQPWIPPSVGAVQETLYSMAKIRQILLGLRNLPQPVIAAVKGPATGFGLALALVSDLIVAGESARFLNGFHNVGVGSELGASYLLSRAIGAQRAAHFTLTGAAIDAAEAERIGLVLRAVPDERLLDECFGIAKQMMENSPLGLWLAKQSMHATEASTYEAALDLETRGVILSQSTSDGREKRMAKEFNRPTTYTDR